MGDGIEVGPAACPGSLETFYDKQGWLQRAPRGKLYYVTDEAQFECDFVIARAERSALRVFREMYGDLEGEAELVTEITNPPPWLTVAVWLGPEDDVLEELGGRRLPSIDFPRWQFGDQVWGCRITMRERCLGRVGLG